MKTEKTTLQTDLQGIITEEAEVEKTHKALLIGPASRETAEKIIGLEAQQKKLAQERRFLEKRLEKATLEEVQARYQAKLEEAGNERQCYQKELDHFVESATEREREILGKYGISAFRESAVLLNKINALNENARYYVDELSIIVRRIQRLEQ